MSEGVFQHLPVAELEDVKRKQRVWKKQSARQRHDWQLLRQNYSCGHIVASFFVRYLR
jgi:hypothetical protein